MVQQSKYNNYDVKDLETLATAERPVAGQSLTNNPEQKYPWEGPTKFTEVQAATEAIFSELTEDEIYFSVIDLVDNNLPVGDIAQLILYDGFTKGLWNPDLMLLLVEPVMYIILALAEQSGFSNPILYRDQEKEPSSLEEQNKGLDNALEVMKKEVVPKLKKGIVPSEIKEKVEAFVPPERPSLLAKPEVEVEVETPRENLLDSDVYKIQKSMKNKDIAKRIVFLSVHKDNNHNFKHYNVAPHHFHNFSVDQRNTTELDNNTCTFIDNYNKRHFCCFLQHYADNPERKYLLSFLEKHNLLDKGFISAKNYGKDFNTTGKGGYSFTSYNSVFNDLDIATTINNSYINIIPEGNFTHRESQCVTEKPLRSFFYKKPFIMMNRQYDLKYIHSMGYKTFSPIINESYDNIYSHSNRLAAICIEIKRLMNKPFIEFKKDMKQLEDICNYNYMIYKTREEKLEKYLYEQLLSVKK